MAEGGKGRLRQLDVLRCLAILMVLLCHSSMTPAIHLAMKNSPALKVLIPSLGYGRYGVDLFFVLSGFLVSGLLFREYRKYGKVDIFRFYVRRGFKIYPGYYIMIAITAVVAHITHLHVFSGPISWKNIIFASLFLENYSGFTHFHSMMWLPCWSLDVEEHFYILLGLSVFMTLSIKFGKKNPFTSLAKVMLIAIPVIITIRSLTFMHDPHSANNLNMVMYMTHNRMDGMFVGALLSYMMNFHHDATVGWIQARRRVLCWFSGVAIMAGIACPLTSILLHLVGYTLMDLGFAGVLMLSLTWGASSMPKLSRVWDYMANIGAYSYSIYLWHVPFLYYFVKLQRPLLNHLLPYTINTLIYIPLALVFGILMAKIVEFPMLRIRDKIFPSKIRAL